MNDFCECILGFRTGKYPSPKGKWSPKTYAEVLRRLAGFKKQHVRQAYHEQLHLIIQSIFVPALDSLWSGIDKAELVVNIKCAWTHYLDVCDKLSETLRNLVLSRGSEVQNGINLYADPESDFRLSAIALFRNRLFELEPLLMDACGDFVVRVLDGEDMTGYYAADDEPLRVLVMCYISMHDCSGLYKHRKVRWAFDLKPQESMARLRFAVKPKTDETELYCASGGLEHVLMQAAESWFLSKAATNFADVRLDDAVSRLRHLFGSTHPSTLQKMMSRVDDLVRARGISDVTEHGE
jgi:hypothetical protein